MAARGNFVRCLRPTGEEPVVFGLTLAEMVEVPVHNPKGDYTFPCLGPDCRFASRGRCVYDHQIRWYAAAVKCREDVMIPTAAEVEEYRRLRRAWVDGAGRGFSAHDPTTHHLLSSEPKPPQSKKVLVPILPTVQAIVEVYDTWLGPWNGQPPPPFSFVSRFRRGNRHTCAKASCAVPLGLPEPFDVVPHLERMFGMPVFALPAEDDPNILRLRRQA